MIISGRASAAPLRAFQQLVLAVLAAALLAAGFTGRAGVQVVDGATAARLFALHLHAIPGESEYVAEHGAPAPFVPAHCHAPLATREGQPGPDEVQAASSLAGAVICATSQVALSLPPAIEHATSDGTRGPAGASVRVPIRPPR